MGSAGADDCRGKGMYVVLSRDGIAARGETPVLPVYGDEY